MFLIVLVYCIIALHKISLNRDASYIDFSEWPKDKKATINPKHIDGKCFQYAITAAFNCEQIKSYSERISKIKPFTEQYNWKEIYFQTHKKYWKKFEKNNKTIALNFLYVPHNTEKIRHAYMSQK